MPRSWYLGSEVHWVLSSTSSPKAAQALGCSLTPGLRISFGGVTCMAQAASEIRAMDTGFPTVVWPAYFGFGLVALWLFLVFCNPTNSVRFCFIIQHWLPNGCHY